FSSAWPWLISVSSATAPSQACMIWKSLKRDHRNKQQLLRVTNVIAHGAWDQTPQRVRNSKHQWGTRSTLTAAVYPSSIWLHGRGGTNAKVPSCYWPGQPGKGTPHEEGIMGIRQFFYFRPLH